MFGTIGSCVLALVSWMSIAFLAGVACNNFIRRWSKVGFVIAVIISTACAFVVLWDLVVLIKSGSIIHNPLGSCVYIACEVFLLISTLIGTIQGRRGNFIE